LKLNKIKNIIFDLGGVIINIDLRKTVEAFSAITGKSFEEMEERIKTFNLYYKYEVGELNDASFRDLVREFTGAQIDDKVIDEAWNALLLDIPHERIRLIKNLQKKYRLFLLSNTNAIHFKEVENILKTATGDSFYHLFEKVYLSYELQLCKPDKEIYTYVLKDKGLLAEDTLFIDDNVENIEAASELGIKTVHLRSPFTIIDILNEE
jgi:glucose-1-phosphatase